MAEPLMQVTFLYIFYIGIGVIVYLLIKSHMKKIIAKLLMMCLLFAPLLLYIPIEVKTAKYGLQFGDVYENGIDDDLSVIYFKVFDISGESAKLYIVEGENGQHMVGSYYWFSKENGKWIINPHSQTLWTTFGGSASEFSFPPYF